MKTFLHFCTCTMVLFATFFASCTSEVLEDVQQQQNVFEVFASKSLILSLSAEEQKQAWISRLKMYSEVDLNQTQKGILNEMISDLKAMGNGKFFLSENLKQDALAMAKLTPQEDFIKLFSGTISSLPVLSKTGPPCAECITDLENYVSSKTNNVGSVTFRALDCDCTWTCQQQEDNMLCLGGQSATTLSPCSGGQSSGCCNQTPSGCGLFNLFSCTGLVVCN